MRLKGRAWPYLLCCWGLGIILALPAWAGPDSAQAHLQAGLRAFKARDARTALKHYKEAVRLAPDSHQTWAHLGTAYGALKQHDMAVAALSAALALSPLRSPVLGPYYGARGLACLDAGRWAQAAKDFSRAVKLDPTQGKWKRLYQKAVTRLAREGSGPPLPPGWDLPPGWAQEELAKQEIPGLSEDCKRGYEACLGTCSKGKPAEKRVCQRACRAGAQACSKKAVR